VVVVWRSEQELLVLVVDFFCYFGIEGLMEIVVKRMVLKEEFDPSWNL
jgi:hypothetical protein